MAVLDAAVVDRVEAEATQVDFGRGVRTFVAAAFYWTARAVGVVADSFAIAKTAWTIGYRDGRRRNVDAPQGSAG